MKKKQKKKPSKKPSDDGNVSPEDIQKPFGR